MHGVAKEMNLASWHIKPVDGKFDYRCSGFCKSDEKLDIKGKPLLVKASLDGLIAFASHEFEAALGIVHRNARRYAHERCEETPTKIRSHDRLGSCPDQRS